MSLLVFIDLPYVKEDQGVFLFFNHAQCLVYGHSIHWCEEID
jgi:hypothetical protein